MVFSFFSEMSIFISSMRAKYEVPGRVNAPRTMSFAGIDSMRVMEVATSLGPILPDGIKESPAVKL